ATPPIQLEPTATSVASHCGITLKLTFRGRSESDEFRRASMRPRSGAALVRPGRDRLFFLPLPGTCRQGPGAALTLVLDLGERDLLAVQLPLVHPGSGRLVGERPLLVRELDLVLGHLVGPLDRLLAVPDDRE